MWAMAAMAFGRRERREPDFSAQRATMVERQLRRRGIGDQRVLAAMSEVPRERFVSEAQRHRAYEDGALPIGSGQTISQPWVVAAIAQALAPRPADRVLDVGAGSGYSTAVLARLAAEVIGIEVVCELAERARAALAELGVGNAELICADGSGGLPERAPFDGIAVHATAPGDPVAMLDQLAPGGRLVVPIRRAWSDELTLIRRTDTRGGEPGARGGRSFEREVIAPTRFVPLVGREGFPGEADSRG